MASLINRAIFRMSTVPSQSSVVWTPMILRIDERFSTTLIMKSATSARKMLSSASNPFHFCAHLS
jgi:hypothetical protein